MKNYYKILEVEENASEEAIKKSYRNLSKKFHPDVNPNGDENFKEINEAYGVLGDKEKKQNYDFKRKNPYQGGQFESFFDSIFNRNQQQQAPRRKAAPDKVVKVQISPIESYRASIKTIHYFREQGCGVCKGTGGDKIGRAHV